MSKQAFENWGTLNSKTFFKEYAKKGLIIGTESIDLNKENLSTVVADNWFAFLKHQSIPFISYPYEWPFGMLKDAALLQLDLLLASLGGAVIIEYVAKDDLMVKVLLQNKEDNFSDYNQEHFEQSLKAFFDIKTSQLLESGTRTIYFATPKS
ncbi:MAG: hypothetical protein V3U02_05835 [Calditrichia bacterium]